MVEGKPIVEVIYYIHDGQPQMKLGLQFSDQYLYQAVNMFYREEKIQSTWIKFRRICKKIKKLDFLIEAIKQFYLTEIINEFSLSFLKSLTV